MKQKEKSSRPDSKPEKSAEQGNAKKKLERAQREAADERKKGGYQ
jgi:hypothetical protein